MKYKSGDTVVSKGAIFSPCRQYRYMLWRRWGDCSSRIAFIGLNPSTADETEDDPTIRRCMGFAKDWGFNNLIMLNLFAFRATEPKDMQVARNPVGYNNDTYLKEVSEDVSVIVAAWGNHGTYKGRSIEVLELIPNLQCLKITKSGEPGHPLYLPKNTQLIPYTGLET